MNSDNDHSILQHLKQNNLYALEHLFLKYQRILFVYARRYIKNNEDAHEIVQDVFIKIWEKRKELHISSSLKSYLYSCIRNRCLNFIRDNKDKLQYYSSTDLALIEYEMEAMQNNNEQSDPFNHDELIDLIDKAVEKLPRQQQRIFILSKYEGLTARQIAFKLKLSVRTVETHIFLALKQIREFIK